VRGSRRHHVSLSYIADIPSYFLYNMMSGESSLVSLLVPKPMNKLRLYEPFCLV
jgi:hypothetical protein